MAEPLTAAEISEARALCAPRSWPVEAPGHVHGRLTYEPLMADVRRRELLPRALATIDARDAEIGRLRTLLSRVWECTTFEVVEERDPSLRADVAAVLWPDDVAQGVREDAD